LGFCLWLHPSLTNHRSQYLHRIHQTKALVLEVYPQSLQHLSCAVPQLAEFVMLGAKWEVLQVWPEFVPIEQSWKRSTDWLECFQPVLEAHKVRLEMMTPVLWIAKGGTFEVHHILLVRSRILVTMAHNSHILGLYYQSLDVSLGSCWLGQGGTTRERLEIVAAKSGNNSLVGKEINLWVTRIQCLCSVYFQHYYLMLPHCRFDIVVSQRDQLVEPYRLSSVGTSSLTLYVNKRWW
jgi:hypothetical protein